MVHAVLDHIVYASPDLESGIETIERLTGVRPVYGGKHPGLGTHNALASLGERRYLEVIAPDPAQAGDSVTPPFGIATLTSPSLRGWAAAPVDISRAVSRGRESGIDYGDVVSGERKLPDGRLVQWRLASRSSEDDVVDVLPFLIDWGGGAHPSEQAPGGLRLKELRLLAPDPLVVAAKLRAVGIELATEWSDCPGLEAELIAPDGQQVTLRS